MPYATRWNSAIREGEDILTDFCEEEPSCDSAGPLLSARGGPRWRVGQSTRELPGKSYASTGFLVGEKNLQIQLVGGAGGEISCAKKRFSIAVSRYPLRLVPPVRANAKQSKPQGPALRSLVVPMVVYGLWTQSQAAAYLAVSTRYLRDSSCPKHLLPGNGKGQKESVLRYKPEAVMKWVDAWGTDRMSVDASEAA